jgi:glucose-6-phosphate isomerase
MSTFAAHRGTQNLPVLAGLIGVWNIDLLQLPTLAVLPYDSRSRACRPTCSSWRWRAMASTSSSTAVPTTLPTCPVIWGEPGDNAQHSFFQLLHQGTQRAALDFLLPINSSCNSQAQQNLAIANCLAQAEALALGQGEERCARNSPSRNSHPSVMAALCRTRSTRAAGR